MKYREEKEFSKQYKQNYIDGLKNVLEQRKKEAEAVRQQYTKNIFEEREKYRNDFKEMLGWPLVGHKDDKLPECTMEKLAEEDGYTVYRVQFEILKGLKMTGLFFKMNGEDKKPLVIVQHGGAGTPELISGVYDSTANYNDMLQRTIKYNVHAFAPQLLLWHEDYEVEFDRKAIDASLKRVGSSITAVEIYGIQRILDYFEAQNYVSDLGMVGLSYGGFYTLFTSAVDTRIKSALSCSFFNKRDAVDWSDWTWDKSAEKFDDTEIACLVHPRKLYIAVGNEDALFDYKSSEESFKKLEKLCKNVGTDWVKFKVFEGTHEFIKDDNFIGNLINDIME